MNRGVLQNSPVQQMMAAGNPSLWNINNLMRPPFLSSSPSSSSSTTHFLAPPHTNNNYHPHHHLNNNINLFQPHQQHQDMNINIPTTDSSSWLDDHHPPQNDHHDEQPAPHQLHESWSQLLLGGVFMGEELKKMDGWEEQVVLQHHPSTITDVKQESSVNSYNSNNNNNNNNNINHDSNVFSHEQEFQLVAAKVAAATNWSSQVNIPASSPQSCVTTTYSSNNNNSMLDFSSSKSSDNLQLRHPLPTVPDHSSECNSTATGGALKKSKVQPSSTQPTFKVRKEKLGDRITALHQLVSPFGKTDTASVLLEAIGYIRFLQSQVEALSLPYLSNGAGNKRQPHTVQQGEKKCVFPEDPGQLLFNENCLKRKGGPDQESSEEPAKDLRSRGLCLVPLSCTMHVGSDNGADYWAPALSGGFR